MRVSIREHCLDEVCAGAQQGRDLLTKLLFLTAQEPGVPEALHLDFSGVQVATASFLRESILSLREFLRSRKSFFYPVIANAAASIREELQLILPLRGEALLSCRLNDDGELSGVELLGHLEDKQRRVFDWLKVNRETDASELQQVFGAAEGVQQTAWNNRLAALANAGLIVEMTRGRAKRYRSLLTGD